MVWLIQFLDVSERYLPYLLYGIFFVFAFLVVYAYYDVKKYHYIFNLASAKLERVAKTIKKNFSLRTVELNAEFDDKYYIKQISVGRTVYEEALFAFENVCIEVKAIIQANPAVTFHIGREAYCRVIRKHLQDRELFGVLKRDFSLETNNEEMLKEIFSSQEATNQFLSLGCVHIFNVNVIKERLFEASILFSKLDDEAILNAIKLFERVILSSPEDDKELISQKI